MRDTTLCFLVNKDSNKILLGMKKRGFGVGKYNGFGGKVNKGEEIKDALVRELFEETSVKVHPDHFSKLAELDFFFPSKEEWNQRVHVFITNTWEGEPTESEEMTVKWFDPKDLPFDKMWEDDRHWLPLVLDNNRLKAKFTFDESNEKILDMDIKKL